MAARADLIRVDLIDLFDNTLDLVKFDINHPPWYLKESFWDILFNIIGIVADFFRAYDRPGIAAAIDTLVTAAHREVVYKDEVTGQVVAQIQLLSNKLRVTDSESNPEAYSKLNEELNIQLQTLAHLGIVYGKEKHN